MQPIELSKGPFELFKMGLYDRERARIDNLQIVDDIYMATDELPFSIYIDGVCVAHHNSPVEALTELKNKVLKLEHFEKQLGLLLKK